MDIQNLNISNSKLLSEISFDINGYNFNQIVKIIKKTFKKLGIVTDEKLIIYQRYADKSSMLAIKLLQGSDSDIDNYIFFGCYANSFKSCEIWLHAEAKAERALEVINLISQHIITFFKNVEMDLFKKNLSDLEICFKIPLGENMSQDNERKEGKLKQLIKRTKNFY